MPIAPALSVSTGRTRRAVEVTVDRNPPSRAGVFPDTTDAHPENGFLTFLFLSPTREDSTDAAAAGAAAGAAAEAGFRSASGACSALEAAADFSSSLALALAPSPPSPPSFALGSADLPRREVLVPSTLPPPPLSLSRAPSAASSAALAAASEGVSVAELARPVRIAAHPLGALGGAAGSETVADSITRPPCRRRRRTPVSGTSVRIRGNPPSSSPSRRRLRQSRYFAARPNVSRSSPSPTRHRRRPPRANVGSLTRRDRIAFAPPEDEPDSPSRRRRGPGGNQPSQTRRI